MARTLRITLLSVLVTMALAACGDSSGDKELPTVTSVALTTAPAAPTPPDTPSTTTAPARSGDRSCAAILSDGLRLATDWRNAQRGIVAPDESEYRARAQVLLDEARSRGCPVPPAVDEFLR